MAIRIPFGDKMVVCDTVEEAARLLGIGTSIPDHSGMGEFLPDVPGSMPIVLRFSAFVESLGTDQVALLGILVTKGRATDDELRTALKVDNNQALAGVISGISKQANAAEIGARTVFGIENRRRAGRKSKTYFVTNEFRKVAEAMKWPKPPK